MFRTYFFKAGFKSIRIRCTSWCLLSLLGVFFLQCTKEPKDPIVTKKAALLKYAASNPEATVFWIDSTASEVSWVASTVSGVPFTGKVIPLGGCVVEMEGGYSGGYLQIPLAGINVEVGDTSNSKAEVEKLFFSTKVLNSEINKLIDFEMKSSLRKIERGDIFTDGNSRGYTHDFIGNLTLNDSTRQVSFSLKSDTVGVNSRALTGKFAINYPDYGIKYGTPADSTAKFKMSPTVEIEFNLKFNLLRIKP